MNMILPIEFQKTIQEISALGANIKRSVTLGSDQAWVIDYRLNDINFTLVRDKDRISIERKVALMRSGHETGMQPVGSVKDIPDKNIIPAIIELVKKCTL